MKCIGEQIKTRKLKLLYVSSKLGIMIYNCAFVALVYISFTATSILSLKVREGGIGQRGGVGGWRKFSIPFSFISSPQIASKTTILRNKKKLLTFNQFAFQVTG